MDTLVLVSLSHSGSFLPKEPQWDKRCFVNIPNLVFFLFFVSPLSVKHSDKLISGFFRMWKCCQSMEKWSQNGIKYLIASESLKGTSTCQVLSQCLPRHILTKGGEGGGGKGMKEYPAVEQAYPSPPAPKTQLRVGICHEDSNSRSSDFELFLRGTNPTSSSFLI